MQFAALMLPMVVATASVNPLRGCRAGRVVRRPVVGTPQWAGIGRTSVPEGRGGDVKPANTSAIYVKFSEKI